MRKLVRFSSYPYWNNLILRTSLLGNGNTSCVRKASSIKWSYAVADTNRPLIGLTIGQMLQTSADKYGDTEAIVSCQQNIIKNYTQLNDEVDTCAAGLLGLGFHPGDRIGIWASNCYEWCLTKYAAAKAGLILVTINPAYRPSEMKYCLHKVGLRGVICDIPFKTSNYYNMMTEIVPEILKVSPSCKFSSQEFPNLEYLITIEDSEKNGAFNFKQLFEAGRPEDRRQLQKLDAQLQFDDPFNIMFTSGTTGDPKAVVLSHFNLTNNANITGIRLGLEDIKERTCIGFPMFHIAGSITAVLSNVAHGATSILPSRVFDPVAILKTVKDIRVTSIIGTPTMFFDLLREYKKAPFEIRHLHSGLMGGAPCPEKLVLAVMEVLKMKDIKMIYGMTETSPAVTLTFPNDSVRTRSTTVGYPLDQTELKVVDKDGRIVPVGQPGELLIRGYCLFKEYWKDEERTKETIGKDRWLKTGDIASMDENKYFQIVGRIKDMIVRGGENIYPAEIENFFLGHPDIIEAQVVGVPGERMGEEAVICVISAKENLTEYEVKNWAKEKIAHFKIPKYVVTVDDFPRTASGKVMKYRLKELMENQLGLKK